jgi:ABC-type uncharacterized transport system substrate-binding protein
LAAELVARPASLILAQAPPAAMVAKAATATVPIVFVLGLDPVAAGLVANLSNPGGNATGMTLISNTLGPKRLELIRDMFPKAWSIAMLVNPLSPDTLPEVLSVQAAARALRVDLAMFNAEPRATSKLHATGSGKSTRAPPPKQIRPFAFSTSDLSARQSRGESRGARQNGFKQQESPSQPFRPG